MKYVPAGKFRFTLLATGIYAGIIALMYCIVFVFDDHTISTQTLLLASFKGLISLSAQFAYFAAMQTGPLSYTTFIFSSSMLIPALASPILWDERITMPQWIAMGLFLVAFYFICVPGADKSKKAGKAWLPFCLLAFFLNGLASVFVKVHQLAMAGTEGNALLIISNGTTSVVAIAIFVIWALLAKEPVFPPDMRIDLKSSAGSILGVALSNGVANGFVTYLASRISGAWLFPCVLGGSMIMVTLFSVIVLKEKINKFGKIGLFVGLIAMFVMNAL